MKNLRKLLGLTAVTLLLMLLISAWAWGQIPADAQVPVHWNAAGEVDRYGGKVEGLLLSPIITAGLMVLVAFITRIEPRRGNFLQSEKAFTMFWYVLLLFFLMLHVTTTGIALGYNIPLPLVIGVGIGLMFIVLGNFMGKIRSTYTFGIRTPWTLDSDLSWNKTHRLGGKLFMATGALVLLTAVLGSSILMFWVLMGGILITVSVSMVYSYIVWKNDPDAQARRA
ncbi:MAG: SdpI family protein [Ardenticatenaceae bacterium]|nr:SdpI family protein [Ardenticatenaceae bacterium]